MKRFLLAVLLLALTLAGCHDPGKIKPESSRLDTGRPILHLVVGTSNVLFVVFEDEPSVIYNYHF